MNNLYTHTCTCNQCIEKQSTSPQPVIKSFEIKPPHPLARAVVSPDGLSFIGWALPTIEEQVTYIVKNL